MKAYLDRVARKVAEIQAELGSRLIDSVSVVLASEHDTAEEIDRRCAETDRAALARAGLPDFPPGFDRTVVVVQKVCADGCPACAEARTRGTETYHCEGGFDA